MEGTAAWLRLVQKWHPDRYQLHPEQQHVAARRMLEINEAYGMLAPYYRQNGRLPFEAIHRTLGASSAALEAGPRATTRIPLDFDAHLYSLRSRITDNRIFDILPG